MSNVLRVLALMALAVPSWAQQPQEVVTEKSRPVEAWSLTLIERDHGPPESDAILTDLFIVPTKGQRRLLIQNLVGPFVPLIKARKIFSCELNDSMMTKGPLIIDLKGQKQELPSHPGYVRDCTTVGTGEEMLLHYNLAENGKFYNLVRVFDSSGRILVERKLDTEGSIDFEVSKRKYSVTVPAPQFPG